MNEQWFWQTQGESYGPLSTNELEDLVRRGRIGDEDLIQLGGTQDWLPAGEIKSLFLEGEATASNETSSADAAARVLRRAAFLQAGGTGDEEAPRFGALRKLAARATTLSGLPMAAAGFVDLVFSWLWWLVGRKSTLVMAALLLVAVVLRNVEWTDTLAHDSRELLAEAWGEVQTMKQRGATPEEWTAFESETLDWLVPTTKLLETAALKNQTGINSWMSSRVRKSLGQQQLVSASCILRDVLAEVRQGKSKTPDEPSPVRGRKRRSVRPLLLLAQVDSTPETLFAQRMNAADAFLAGTIPTTEVTGGPPPAAEPIDPFFVGFIVLDVTLVGGGLCWWMMRRRRPAMST